MAQQNDAEPGSSPASNFKIHIAIDFGTDGLGLAYATDANNVFVHTQWGNGKYKMVTKPKCIALLEEQKALAIGLDAKTLYCTMPKCKDKWMLFERFKMSLYDGESELGNSKKKIKESLTATNGKSLDSEIVFVAVLNHIQDCAKIMLRKKKIRRVKPKDIHWIITVPAIWNDEGKQKMRDWAIAAGLVDPNIPGQCTIALEPDCAALAIQHEMNNGSFQKGEKYIVVDAGGGTVDIAYHEIMDQYQSKEVMSASGGPWGSCYIDDHFREMLRCLFSAEWVDEFQRKNPHIMVAAINDFQKSKESFYVQKSQPRHNVRVPVEFIGFMQDKLEEMESEMDDVEDLVASKLVFGHRNSVSLSEEVLEIATSVWREMFDHVMDPMIAQVRESLKNRILRRECKYLCLAGGLSTSPYFQERMKFEFGPKSKYGLEVISPQRPILSVVMGAALAGTMGIETIKKTEISNDSHSEQMTPMGPDREDGLQFFKEWKDRPVHLQHAEHTRVACHELISMVHGNQYYWTQKSDGKAVNKETKVWYLDTLCWLNMRTKLKVDPGKYAVCLRIKLDAFTFRGVWKIGCDVDSHKIKQSETYKVTGTKDCILYQHKQGEGALKQMADGEWFWMYFGDHIEITNDRTQEIQFHLLGGNESWCKDIAFDVIDVFKVN